MQHPKPQKTVLTFITTDIEKFSPNDIWQITAQRQNNILMIVGGKNISHLNEKQAVKIVLSSRPTATTSSQRRSAKDPDEQVAWEIVEESAVPADWEIQKPVWRSQSQQPYWEFAALQDGRSVGKLKVSIDPPHCEIIEFVIPVLREISLERVQRLNITPLGAARSIGASCFRVLIGPFDMLLGVNARGFQESLLDFSASKQLPPLPKEIWSYIRSTD